MAKALASVVAQPLPPPPTAPPKSWLVPAPAAKVVDTDEKASDAIPVLADTPSKKVDDCEEVTPQNIQKAVVNLRAKLGAEQKTRSRT